ncbi:MAG: NnrU family protein [Rhodobacteraceae bacterium]|nr:NnrU family protein [Paracoccaceae bacterium]
MTGWGAYAGAWAFFLFTHAVPVRPPVKPWLIARLGSVGFGVAYSVLSLGALAWLFIAAARAPHVVLWPKPASAHWIALAAMVPAVLLLALTLGRPNPFSFGGARNASFNPDRPELPGRLRHPVLLALALWAGAHLIVTGTLAHVLMFGGFVAFALLGMRMIDRRKMEQMGATDWAALRQRAARAAPSLPPRADLRLALGFGMVLALLVLHKLIAGVEIWPRFLP